MRNALYFTLDEWVCLGRFGLDYWRLLTGNHFTHYAELQNHIGGWHDVAFILSDAGYGLMLYVPDHGPPLTSTIEHQRNFVNGPEQQPTHEMTESSAEAGFQC